MSGQIITRQQAAADRDALIAREIAAFAAPLRAALTATAKPSIVIDDAYAAALHGVQAIDARLEAGYHFRAADGRLLTTLEEVVRALEGDGLAEVNRAA